MDVFNLPPTTAVNRIIPKNSFDAHITAKQKKLLTELVQRITWTHKLSTETTNLPGKDIKEIQIFKIELKSQENIDILLMAIDKVVPYAIFFIVVSERHMYFSASVKHPHPVYKDNTVIDWTFKTDWFMPEKNKYSILLKKSIDAIHHNFCIQLSGKSSLASKPLQALIDYEKKADALEKEISRLKSGIANSKQFNNKVELNLKLKALEIQLKELTECYLL